MSGKVEEAIDDTVKEQVNPETPRLGNELIENRSLTQVSESKNTTTTEDERVETKINETIQKNEEPLEKKLDEECSAIGQLPVEVPKVTESSDLHVPAEAKAQNTEVEDKHLEATVEETNESQDSLDLVIDEKIYEPEAVVEDSGNAEVGPKAAGEASDGSQSMKVDFKESCEDAGEEFAVTQIHVTERDVNMKELPISESSENANAVDKFMSKNVIEIDDKLERVSSPVEDAKIVLPFEEKENRESASQNIVTVIEIDDEEEDELGTGVAEQMENIVEVEGTIAMDVDPEKVVESSEANSIGNCNIASDGVEVKNTDIEMPEHLRVEAECSTTESILHPKDDVKDSVEAETVLLKELETRPSSATIPEGLTIEDTTEEVFSNKECINYECPKNHKQFYRAPEFAMSYYKVTKKQSKGRFICAECNDKALDMYEEYCSQLAAKQPLLLKDSVNGRQEFVEIIDSSDEEDGDVKNDKEKGSEFSKQDLQLLENELESTIQKVLQDVGIQDQLTWAKTILSTRVKKLEDETNQIDTELRALQKKADNMHVSLYQCPKIKIRQLQPLDLNSGRPYAATETFTMQLPPVGEIQRPPVQLSGIYYAVKNKAIASWVPCKVMEPVDGNLGSQKNLKHYKVKFLKSQYQMLKTVSAKHMAYYEPPKVRLPIGTRVIAYFDATSLSRGKEKMMVQSAFYPGIIAEPLKPNNKYRYLIFYDDGYTQYVYHRDVRLVCHVSENVWEDVHPGSRDFIQKYLTQYSINRPMVQTQKGQSMTTESKGRWIYARVVDIDCSLIQMQFEGPKSHTEWIYRGSMRLGPVFKEYQKSLQKDATVVSRLPRRTEPFIRYTEDEETTSRQQNEPNAEARAVAKKSVSSRPDANAASSSAQTSVQAQTSAPVPVVRHLNNSTIYVEDENKPKGKVVFYTAKRNLPPLKYQRHQCAPTCLYKISHNLSAYSPLSKPLLSGWERMITRQKIKKVVTYRAPCGKIMRNMKELHKYLRTTENALNVDNFDFSHEINCLAEYVIESAIVQKRDISGGQEKMAIPLVNYYDSTMPPECKYAAQRIPTEGVNLNLDAEFLVGCDCEDDCSDKSKCSCWQLTYAGAKYGNPNTPMDEIGYQYKRLYEHVPTGIYECNSRCKCKSSCLNRLAQQSLQMKLQVFKTSNRGWGLRCLNDIPRGSFICIYAGHLLTEAKANEGGLDAGDEYFAELDYIEVAEQIKEGYESDVEPPEPEEEEEDLYAPDPDDDDEFTPSKSYVPRSKRAQRSARGSQNADEDSQERQVINFNPNADMNENSLRESSIRQLFGKDEACYVMDAKTIGNLGRYFNHSCSPNLFVQNVFVDTHDLRFPWVAFFALTNIRAGTELTWNYNYEVGVVPGKVLYCQCGAPNCRQRLL